jgi:sugar lactone lactonase YvrE
MRVFPLLLAAGAMLGAQDFGKLQVEKVAGGFRFAEGPVWSREGHLYFTDVPNNRILRYTPGGEVQLYRDKTLGANGLALDERGRVVACEGEGRRVARIPLEGEPEVLADSFEGKPLNAPNDLVIRGNAIYFTDPAFGSASDRKELPFYGIFRVTSRKEITAIARWDKRPNGIALSPNGRLLYVASSDERAVRVFDLDRAGNASNERLLTTNIQGVPDGLKTDAKGNLWIACAGIAIYSPEGKLLRFLEMGEKPSNLAFGEGNPPVVYVTARSSLLRISFEGKEEQ